MRKLLAVLLILAGSVCIFGAPAYANHNDAKYTICHRTNSDQNPYVVITPDEAAVDGAAPAKGDHYLEHVGPVWNDTLKDAKIEWGDIIPPIPGHHAGLNWTAAGQAIYNNGCAPAVPGTTTTSTTVPETTTTTVPETTTTTAPEETTTTTTPEEPKPPVIGPPLVIEPPVVVDPPRALPQPQAQELTSLPVTGVNTWVLTALGVLMILGGVALTRKSTSLG